MKKLLSIAIALACGNAVADGSDVEHLVVFGKQSNLIGESLSASEGVIGFGDIERRPILRSGEILEFVPGMVVTQHSGSGKANQYFLRGFNLDHGTDFSTHVDGMPVNMRTHGHGQGYTDLNFITQEFVERIDYQKGPYSATQGDFSAAGSANFSMVSKFRRNFAKLELGEYGYLRSVVGQNVETSVGDIAVGVEWQQYDGPWTDIDEDVEKRNVYTRYSGQLADGKLNVTFMAYDNSWNSADQIPTRAVAQGIIDEFGSLDDTVGGESSRYSLSANWKNDDWELSAYAIDSELDLFSNFTYLLENQSEGDQFEQVDDRQIYGFNATRYYTSTLNGYHLHHKAGIEGRYDDIAEVGLYQTNQRRWVGTVRSDSVDEYSLSAFYETDVYLTDKLVANVGVRHDYLNVDVDSVLEVNSGDDDEHMTNFKAGLRYAFNEQWQVYGNIGQSFHTNDARGAVINVDPVSGEFAPQVDLFVRAEGAEVGLRVVEPEKYNVSVALWILENDSELLFVGDAGNTEASGASRRQGIEIASYLWLTDTITADVELAWTRSRFTDVEVGEGDRVDGSLPFVGSVGVNWQINEAVSTNLRVRHFGERVLNSFDNIDASSFTVVNANAQYQLSDWQFELSVLNVFDSNDRDIEYLYESRLAGEGEAGVSDIHYHPIEPRMMRVSATYLF